MRLFGTAFLEVREVRRVDAPLCDKALTGSYQRGFMEAKEMAAQLVDKAFQEAWVVQDCLDAIRALQPAEQSK